MKKKYWGGEVTKHSNALDLENEVFTWKDPMRIAHSLKRSADSSIRRKGSSLQSAMSMLNFYINRAGKNLDPEQKEILERAKVELRKLFTYFKVTGYCLVSLFGFRLSVLDRWHC